MKAVFLRVIEASNKADELRAAIRDVSSAVRFEVEPQSFALVPRAPFAYWVSERVRQIFADLNEFESETHARSARKGLSTDDDFRFLRCHWEVPSRARAAGRWPPIVKGGKRAPFYSSIPAVIDWDRQGAHLKAFTIGRYGNAGKRVFNEDYYFRPGLTWPLRGIRYSASAVPKGCVFSGGGKMAFAPEDVLPAVLAVFNSLAFDSLIALFAGKVGGVQYESGLIGRLPFPMIPDSASSELVGAARSAWSLKRSVDTCTEHSHAFALPALLQTRDLDLVGRASEWFMRASSVEAQLASIQSEIDEICFSLYGISDEDRRRIEEGFRSTTDGPDETGTDDQDDTKVEEAGAAPLVTSLLSWTVGVSFGRFDVRLATGDREPPTEPDLFDPLPPCSPGMLAGADGVSVDRLPPSYPVDLPPHGIFSDDMGHEHDLVAWSRQIFQVVFGEDADVRWREAAEILDSPGRSLRAWFAGAFFEDHIKRYSKSRRKAPIYWQLATASARYSVWLYFHRFTRDTLYRALNDYVTPKLKHEERKLMSLPQDGGPNPSASQRKEIDAQEGFVAELRAFRDEVTRVAPLWNPNLNDGVIINFAPLWRLVPQHRAWQKECKQVWDKLCKGEYDWAHLAMHLWPERVVPKCAKDRSLAIAHEVEDVFWDEDSDGKWKPRKVDQPTIDRLIEERTSAAVKDALKNLLEAPVPTNARKGSRRKSSRSSKTRRSRSDSSAGGDT